MEQDVALNPPTIAADGAGTEMLTPGDDSALVEKFRLAGTP